MSDQTFKDRDRLPLMTPDTLDETQRKVYDRMMSEQVPWADLSGLLYSGKEEYGTD